MGNSDLIILIILNSGKHLLHDFLTILGSFHGITSIKTRVEKIWGKSKVKNGNIPENAKQAKILFADAHNYQKNISHELTDILKKLKAGDAQEQEFYRYLNKNYFRIDPINGAKEELFKRHTWMCCYKYAASEIACVNTNNYCEANFKRHLKSLFGGE